MRGGIDPARQAGDDRYPLAPELGRQLSREPARRRRGIARADHRDRRARHQRGPPAQHQHRRRIVEFGQERRIVGIAQKQVLCAKPRHLHEFALGERHRCDHGRFPPAARGKLWQRRERRLRVAEAADQLRIGDGADLRGADQPEARNRRRLRH